MFAASVAGAVDTVGYVLHEKSLHDLFPLVESGQAAPLVVSTAASSLRPPLRVIVHVDTDDLTEHIDGLAATFTKLTAGLTPLFAARGEAQAHLIGQLIGLPFGGSPHLRGVDPRQLRDLAFVALREALRGLHLSIERDDEHAARLVVPGSAARPSGAFLERLDEVRP
jgi:hypothetical protein